MDSLNYMMIGYLVIWALAFGLVFKIWAQGKRLESDLQTVRQMVDDLDQE